MKLENIKTIDVNAKEWFDKINGNSYFGGRVIINYKMPDEIYTPIPFQYGYGNQYEWEAVKLIGEELGEEIDRCLSLFCSDNNIILRTTKTQRCTKREVTDFSK